MNKQTNKQINKQVVQTTQNTVRTQLKPDSSPFKVFPLSVRKTKINITPHCLLPATQANRILYNLTSGWGGRKGKEGEGRGRKGKEWEGRGRKGRKEPSTHTLTHPPTTDDTVLYHRTIPLPLFSTRNGNSPRTNTRLSWAVVRLQHVDVAQLHALSPFWGSNQIVQVPHLLLDHIVATELRR